MTAPNRTVSVFVHIFLLLLGLGYFGVGFLGSFLWPGLLAGICFCWLWPLKCDFHKIFIHLFVMNRERYKDKSGSRQAGLRRLLGPPLLKLTFAMTATCNEAKTEKKLEKTGTIWAPRVDGPTVTFNIAGQKWQWQPWQSTYDAQPTHHPPTFRRCCPQSLHNKQKAKGNGIGIGNGRIDTKKKIRKMQSQYL